MTFDPENLYARPAPGRRINPMVWPVAGVVAVAIIGGLATMDKWLPGKDPVTAGPPLRSQNSGHGGAPLAFPERYAPVIYAPPAAPNEPPHTITDPPGPASAPAPPPGPPKKHGIPDEARRSMVLLDGGKTGATPNAPAGSAPAGSAPGTGSAGVQQVAGSGSDREKFYGAAGRGSEALNPTGIVGQLGPCTLAPG